MLRRFDLYYRDVRVIVEYDGRQHAEDLEQDDKDIERREELDDGEWRIVIVTAKGLRRPRADPRPGPEGAEVPRNGRAAHPLPSGMAQAFLGRANDLRTKP